MGILRFLVAEVAAELMASLSLPEWLSVNISSGLGGRSSVALPAVGAPAAAAAASSGHPLDILRVAVGEGWSDDDGVGSWSSRADGEAADGTDISDDDSPLARDAGRDASCSCTEMAGDGVVSLLVGVGERFAKVVVR